MALSLALTATQEGLRVRQNPPSVNVMRGETATLSCHFKVESLKYGVQWFKMKAEKQLIPKSSRQIVVEKNQTSTLVITEVALEDSGWYYCEVNVLQKEPEWGNGTELVVLGEKQIACFRNSLGLLCWGGVAMLVIMSHLLAFVHQSHSVLCKAEFSVRQYKRRCGPCIAIKGRAMLNL